MQPVFSSPTAYVNTTAPASDAGGDDGSFVISKPDVGVTRAESDRLVVDYRSASATLVVTDKASGQEATYALPQFSGSPNAQSAEKFTVSFSDGTSVSVVLPQTDVPGASSTLVITSGDSSTVVDLPSPAQPAVDAGTEGMATTSFERRFVEDSLSRHRSKRNSVLGIDEDDEQTTAKPTVTELHYASDTKAGIVTRAGQEAGDPVDRTPGIDDSLAPTQDEEPKRARSWFLALAEVLGENLDRSIDKMVETIDAIDAGDDSATRLGLLAAETARFNYLGTTDAAIIQTVGGANKSLSDRK